MGPSDYFCFGLFLLAPIAFIVWWVWARLGHDKRWFIAPWPVISRSFYFALPTAMLGVIVMLIGLALPSIDPDANSVLVAFGIWGISFIIAFLEPNWMSPAWYRWLKRNHGDIMPYLVLDAHEMGRETWMERVKTQKGLEEWTNEVRRKYTR